MIFDGETAHMAEYEERDPTTSPRVHTTTTCRAWRPDRHHYDVWSSRELHGAMADPTKL
jgi:hypothetical protein